MRFFPFLLAAVALLPPTLAAAQVAPTPGFERLPSGTEYQLFRRDAAGHYAPRPLNPPGDAPYASRQGQVLLINLQYRTDRDSVLMDTRQMQARQAPAGTKPQPVPVGLGPNPGKGTPEEAMSLLLPGDSAVFRFNADSLFGKAGQPIPPFIKRSGNGFRFVVAAKELLTADQMRARQQAMQAEQQRLAKARSAKQLLKDDATIQAYIKKNKLTTKAKKTVGGTWYVITVRGKGVLPKKGQTVSVKYRGTVLATGKEFDSTAKHGDTPFDFVLGQGQVIQGWDQGIAALPKGSKAMLLIPSPLGYGERGAGADIPANAVLRFDVELTGIK
ncbi:FKBP-type peptidyl-prolyl cis-trans isomerase [Hymenobacter ginkgonis]|nr:FKBP-type peptidyl-prolyl cis-trans isomerase [Hymenobacter ginkgonis]